MRRTLARWLRDESGPTATEYAILIGLIVITLMGAVNTFGNTTSGLWAQNASRIITALSGA
ncbi:MAG: Flp family type IVb pilin [Isosphaeraceae bacterium]